MFAATVFGRYNYKSLGGILITKAYDAFRRADIWDGVGLHLVAESVIHCAGLVHNARRCLRQAVVRPLVHRRCAPKHSVRMENVSEF